MAFKRCFIRRISRNKENSIQTKRKQKTKKQKAQRGRAKNFVTN
jgi:hypothetical protein